MTGKSLCLQEYAFFCPQLNILDKDIVFSAQTPEKDIGILYSLDILNFLLSQSLA